MIKEIIFPKVTMSDAYDNLHLIAHRSVYSHSDTTLAGVLSSFPIQTAAREIGQFFDENYPRPIVNAFSPSAKHGAFHYMGYTFSLNTVIDPSMAYGDLQIFLGNTITAKLEELATESVPDPVSRTSDRGRSFIVNHSWVQDTHWGGRTTVFDYQLVDGMYRPTSSRVVVTQFSEHESGRHWEEVRRQSPFELDLLCLDATTFEVDNFREYTFEVLSYQEINPNRPKCISGCRVEYTMEPFETVSEALVRDIRDVFRCCSAIPIIKIPEATLKTLDEGY